MTDETRRTIRMYLIVVATGVVAWGGVLQDALGTPEGITARKWYGSLITGAVTLALSLIGALSQPPMKGP